MNLPNVAFHSINRQLIPENLKELPRARRRLMEVIIKGSATSLGEAAKTWSLDNCLSPLSFTGADGDTGVVSSTAFNTTRLEDPYDPASKTIATGETTTIPSGIVFRSVGYKSISLTDFPSLDIPFNDARGIIHHDGVGRVTRHPDDREATASGAGCVSGMYCAGWVKTGPTGVIASTMQDSFITAEAVAHDWLSGARFLRNDDLSQPSGWDGVMADIGRNAEKSISWDQWRQIDDAERQRGKERGKGREKFTSVVDMLSVIR